jgi:hypothetical protein
MNAQLKRLTMRTGDEYLLIATRGNNKVFHKPYFFASSDRVTEFFSNAYKEDLVDTATRMDAFMVSGVEGLARTQVQVLMQRKKDIRNLIFRKLRKLAFSFLYPVLTTHYRGVRRQYQG